MTSLYMFIHTDRQLLTGDTISSASQLRYNSKLHSLTRDKTFIACSISETLEDTFIQTANSLLAFYTLLFSIVLIIFTCLPAQYK